MQSKVVFTDQRLPGIEIWNHGRCMFNIVNASYEIECFNHQEDKESYDVSPEFAKKVAKDKFDELYESWQRDYNKRIEWGYE